MDLLIEVARPSQFRKRKMPGEARETLLQLGYIEQTSNGFVVTAEGAHYLAPHLAHRRRKKIWWSGGQKIVNAFQKFLEKLIVNKV